MGEVPRDLEDYLAQINRLRHGIFSTSSKSKKDMKEESVVKADFGCIEDEFFHFPMCLHESESLPVLKFNEIYSESTSFDRFDNELFVLSSKSLEFSNLFSPVNSPMTLSDRTTPESMTWYNEGISPAQVKNTIPLQRHRASPCCNVVLDLQFEVIHKYFSLLLEWAKDSVSLSNGTSNCSQLLLYEDMYSAFPLDEDCLFSVWDSKTEVSLPTSSRAYLLMVQGTSHDCVNDRVVTIDKMIADAMKVRKTHKLVGWHPKHSEALTVSDQLKHMQNATRSCVLFKSEELSNEQVVVAELAALQPYQCNAMIKALDLLHPTVRVWDCFDDILYSRVPWDALKTQFAVSLNFGEKDRRLSISKEVKLWGFEGFIDGAVAEIQKVIGTVGVASRGYQSVPANPWQRSLPPSMTKVTPNLIMPALAAEGPQIIPKNFVGSYHFRDREAGIFYYAFEKQFHAYIETTFSVVILEEDFEESRDMEDGNRNAMLKISFYGATQISVTSTRAYLDQLNPHNLHRIQIFYPMVSIAKYKELLTVRSKELSNLCDVRHCFLQKLGGNLNSHPTIDPMQFLGAINVRIKPPMHSNGLNRMPLPADVTITVCGSILVKDHTDMITSIEKRFNDVPSEYFVETVTLAFGHPLRKQLTVKATRDSFIKQYNLMGLKWDEGNRGNGSIGIAKIWAASRATMNNVLIDIEEITINWTNTNIPAIDDVDHWPALNKEDDANGSKSVLNWPNAAMRYALLGNPLSSQLTDLLKKWTDEGLACKYPFRDRSNPNAAILVQGAAEKVPIAAQEIDDFLQSSSKAMKCVLLVLPNQLYSSLIAKELTGVKLIQGQAGVHIVMNSSLEESQREAQSLIDFRLLSNRNCLLSVRVDNSFAHHSLDVIVVASTSLDVGLSWGAKHELVILENENTNQVYSYRDAEQLNNGRVQVHTDTQGCKTTLRVMLIAKDSNGNNVSDFEANVNRVVKGLEKADGLGLKGISIVLPRGVCSVGVAAVIKFARKCYSVHSISRIVCIEQLSEDTTSSKTPLSYGGGSYVSEAMLKLIEDKQRANASNITLLTANTPLPIHMKVAPFGQQVSRYSQSPHSTTGAFPTVSLSNNKWNGDQSVLVKGIESSVLKALDSIKDMKNGRSSST